MVNLESQYPGKIDPSSADYPYGEPRNITTPGDGKGTPWEAAWVKDMAGMQQAVIFKAGVVPSGSPDTALVSQFLQALEQITTGSTPFVGDLIGTTGLPNVVIFAINRTVAGDNGGGHFYWNASTNKATANGGTIVDPDKSLALQGTGVGTGCWVRLYEGVAVDISWFGALVGIDSATAIQAALDTGLHITGKGSYLTSATLEYTAHGQSVIGNNQLILKSDGLGTTDPILNGTNFDSITAIGVEFDCNAETYVGVKMTVSSPARDHVNVAVLDCYVHNTFDTATSLYGAIMIANDQGAAFTFKIKGVKIFNNRIDNDTASHSSHGCLVAYCDNVSFTENDIESAGFHGMEAVQCHTVTITDNLVANCYLSALGVGTFVKNFTISDNIIDNCSGDGSITCEHNSVQGTISNNVITGAINQGINVSYGTGGSIPFNEVNNIIITDNVIIANPTSEGKIGINYYSSTGANIGDAVNVADNIIDGFATGIVATWMINGKITNNTVRRFGLVSVARPSKTFIELVGCDKMDIDDNTCTDDVTLHAIVIDTSTVANSRCNVKDNTLQSATVGALVRKIGSGQTVMSGNTTFGAVNYFSADGTQNIFMNGNIGPLSGTPTSGGTLMSAQGNQVSTGDFVIIGAKKHFSASSIPVAGTWTEGDRAYNLVPVVDGNNMILDSWICTVAGTPGTWLPQYVSTVSPAN